VEGVGSYCHVLTTTHRVWTDNWIYRTHITHTYKWLKLTSLHTLQNTTAHTKTSWFVMSSLAIATWQLLTMEIHLLAWSWLTISYECWFTINTPLDLTVQPQQGLGRKHLSTIFTTACSFDATERSLLRRCVATAVFSGSTIPAVSQHVTKKLFGTVWTIRKLKGKSLCTRYIMPWFLHRMFLWS
jgi:hypothetical protein